MPVLVAPLRCPAGDGGRRAGPENAPTPNEEKRMHPPTARSILAATDLGPQSEAVVRSAAALASAAGAELHLMHSLDVREDPIREGETSAFSFRDRIEHARGRLEEQARALVPSDVKVGSLEVMVYSPRRAILDRAEQVSADLLVFGPHRGRGIGAHFLGTTADRVVRSARVPCLVTNSAVAAPIRSIGVPIDFSRSSQDALDFATGLAAGLARGAEPPVVHAMHVGWPVERIDNPGWEEDVVRPEMERHVQEAVASLGSDPAPRIESEIRWANDPTEATLAWAEERRLDLLVMGTHGRSGMKRALLGSVATSVSRQAPCAVLLVPPPAGGPEGRLPRLDRVVVGVDFTESSAAAVRWTAAHLAPGAELVLAHAVDLPRPPGFLRGRWGSQEELAQSARGGAEQRMEEFSLVLPQGRVRREVRSGPAADELVGLAEEVGADLIVIGEHGHRRGLWDVLGTTAERVLNRSTLPVLVARGLPPGPPRHILVAIDESSRASEVLAWTTALRERTGARVTVLHVLNLLGYAYAVPEVAGVSAATVPEEQEYRREATEELRARLRDEGFPLEGTEVRVAIGDPRHEILSAVARHDADLVVMGSRGTGAVRRYLLGSVASAVLRGARCPVLVIGHGAGGE
jgi:universal stress protein E